MNKTIMCAECGSPAIGYPLVEVLIKNENIFPQRFAWMPQVYNMPRCMEHRIKDANLFLELPDMKDDIRERAKLQGVEVSERWRIRMLWLKISAAQRMIEKAETSFQGQDPVA